MNACEVCGGPLYDARPVCFRCRRASGAYDPAAAMAGHVAAIARAYALEGDYDNAARAAAHARRITRGAAK